MLLKLSRFKPVPNTESIIHGPKPSFLCLRENNSASSVYISVQLEMRGSEKFPTIDSGYTSVARNKTSDKEQIRTSPKYINYTIIQQWFF